MSAAGYPVRVELDHPLEVERWRPLVNWLLAVPHWVVLYALGIAVQVVWFLTFFTVLFTKAIPQGLWDFNVLYNRYTWRTLSYGLGLRGGYPPFDFEMGGAKPDPAVYEVDRPAELHRLLPLVKWLLATPHYVVLFLLYVAAFFAWPIGALAVLVTGRWPEPIHHLLVGVNRWTQRVYAYVYFLTDEYPPFSLD
jgi:hypothetical protein